MKNVIFIDEEGSIDAYKTAERASADLEVVDVKNNVYKAYDKLGNRLLIKIDQKHNSNFFSKFFGDKY